MPFTRERTRRTAETIRRSLDRSIANLFKQDSQPTLPRNSSGMPLFNTYEPSISAIQSPMNLGSQETEVLIPFALPNGDSMNSKQRPYQPAKEETWNRALGSHILHQNKYGNANARRTSVRLLFGLDADPKTAVEPGALVIDSIQKVNSRSAIPAPLSKTISTIEQEDKSAFGEISSVPFQDFVSMMPALQESPLATSPTTECDASTQKLRDQVTQERSSSVASSVDAIELDAESTEVRVATCVHFTQIGARAIQRINTRASTSSSKQGLVIYPPNRQPLLKISTPTSQRLPQQPDNFRPLSPSLMQAESKALRNIEPSMSPEEIKKALARDPATPLQTSHLFRHAPKTFPDPSEPSLAARQTGNTDPDFHPPSSSPTKSWTTGRTTLDFRALSQGKLTQRQNVDHERELWERKNAEDIEQRLSGDILINGRSQHEILVHEINDLEISSSTPVVTGANVAVELSPMPTILLTPSVNIDEPPSASTALNSHESTFARLPRFVEQQEIVEEASKEYELDLEHWARTTQNGERLRPGPGWIRRTSSYPRVSLRRAFN